jgi:signal transduction histidine kinase
MRSLTWKLILAFLLVSVTVALLGAGLARWLTAQEFNRLVLDQAQNRFIGEVSAYYRANRSWDGILEYMRRGAALPAPVIPRNQPLPQPPAAGQPGAPFVFALADLDGVVVLPARPYLTGQRLSQADLAQASPVEVDGQVVGNALATGRAPELEPREQRYLERLNQALLFAVLGAMGVALILSALLARALTRPLRELTRAIRAMAGGEFDQQVPVRSDDELGELATAFNQMSADLARAELARQQMTADIAHDLRTPLTVIGGYAEALRDGVLKPSAERFETMYNEVQHLQRLVDDLRTLSLADAGKLSLNYQPLAPDALLARVAAAYEHRAGQASIDLRLEAPPGLAQFEGDEERLVQVLGNLVSNALRHTPAGGRIVLGAGAARGAIQLWVQDDGEGIPAEALPYIFDRFYRADASRPGGGESGLGLAIAKSIVEAHGGSIAAASQPGEGTRFSLTLPAGPER